MSLLNEIDERSREVFRRIVEAYIEFGEPVGSRTLSRDGDFGISAATIRNVMADLTDAGLLHAPHISAGRLPTELGMRLFVDSILQVGGLSDEERSAIEMEAQNDDAGTVLEKAASALSGMTQTASLIVAQKAEARLRHIEFIATAPGEALVVLVSENGAVENRVMKTPKDLPSSSLTTAANFLSARVRGRTLTQAREEILKELTNSKAELDELSARLVADGVADIAQGGKQSLIVRGRGHLLDEATAQDLERVRMLFDDLERKQDVIDVLNAAGEGEGVKVFIGSENRLFSLSGSSVIAAPYRDGSNNIVGVLGVIGPTRLNYARVVPIVDYTAEMVSRLIK